MTTTLTDLAAGFARCRVLVLGDAILDHYVLGNVRRTSPEAPVPVLAVEKDRWLPGGAANVARNLAALGARVTFLSVVGRDEAGDRLTELLRSDPRISLRFQRPKNRPTTLKTRCIAQGQQMLRLDREMTEPLPEALGEKLLAALEKELPKADGLILSDYAKGVLTPQVLSGVVAAAKTAGCEVIVDPKGTDYRRYRGVTLVTPNRKEAQEASGIAIRDEASTAEAARVLQRQIQGSAICITLSEGGVAIYPKGGRAARISARAREVFDVTGAGDTFIAAMGLARFAGGTWAQAAEVGNAAAGIVVGRAGASTVSAGELSADLSGEDRPRKYLELRELRDIRTSLAVAGRRVVFTNGCFDILNVRHIRLLEQARALGDVLVVALNSDDSVRRLKGEPRPLLSARERVELLTSLPYVDYVTIFDADTPNDLLEKLKPDILVKGDIAQEVVGREVVEGYGGEVRLIDAGIGASGDELVRRASAGGRES